MDAFYGVKLYETMKDMKDCAYIDLDSEKSDQMLYNCSNVVGKKINERLEKKDTIEGFSQNCCPDGTTGVNGTCVEVCQNCDYNDCSYGSRNRGILYGKPVDKKEYKNRKLDEEIFNYIVIDFPNN
jgi:hypothetical protein